MSHLPHPRLRRLAGILGFCFPLCVLVFIFRAPLLVAAASAWMVDQPVARADAIMILGGSVESRPFAAARMFRAGVAPQVLYMNVQHYPDEELGIALSEAEQTHRICLSNGVSETAMTLIGTTVSSTYDEAQGHASLGRSNRGKIHHHAHRPFSYPPGPLDFPRTTPHDQG